MQSKRALVIRLGRLGDTIMATPVIDLLKRNLGEDVLIDFVASPGASSEILKLDRRINEVFSIAHRKLPGAIHPVKRKLRNRSQSRPYDLVINLECGNECDDFHAFINSREFAGRPLIDPQHVSGIHCVDTEKSIYAERLGPDSVTAAEPRLVIPGSPGYQPLFGGREYVILNPSFFEILKNDYRSNRGWPLAFWSKLTELIREGTDYSIAINGMDEDRRLFRPLLSQTGVHSLIGSSLQELADALSGASCVVSVDTGTMHFATALGIPTLALFGPTLPKLTGPYSTTTPVQVLTSGIDCQPCHRTDWEKSCGFARCMLELRPETVFESMKALISA